MKKKLLRTVSLLSVTSTGLILFGCSKTETGRADEQKHGLILRGDIPAEKWNEILNVLNAQTETPDAWPRKKLFRIRTYTPGQDPTTTGEMDEEILHEDYGVPHDFKGHAVQIGLGVKEDVAWYPAHTPSPASTTSTLPSPEPSATPITLHAHLRQNLMESKIMVEKVDAILNKSPTPSPSP